MSTLNNAETQEPDPYRDLYTIVGEHVPVELISKVRDSVIAIEGHVADVWIDVERRVYLGLVRHLPGARQAIRDVFESAAFDGCEFEPDFYDKWEEEEASGY
jgi:hypothetical protein